jgi:actin-related protein 8
MVVYLPGQGRRGSHVVVIHLGSRYLRVGRACDVTPVTVPNVIARKTINAPAPTFVKGISRPHRGRARGLPSPPATNDEYAVARGSDDPVRPPHTCSPLPDPPSVGCAC